MLAFCACNHCLHHDFAPAPASNLPMHGARDHGCVCVCVCLRDVDTSTAIQYTFANEELCFHNAVSSFMRFNTLSLWPIPRIWMMPTEMLYFITVSVFFGPHPRTNFAETNRRVCVWVCVCVTSNSENSLYAIVCQRNKRKQTNWVGCRILEQ